MTAAIITPDLGTGSQDVRVSCWLVDIGDEVETGDRVAELLMKGMTFDVAAPMSGKLLRVSKPVDAMVAPGDILGWIDARPDTRPDENDADDSGDLI